MFNIENATLKYLNCTYAAHGNCRVSHTVSLPLVTVILLGFLTKAFTECPLCKACSSTCSPVGPVAPEMYNNCGLIFSCYDIVPDMVKLRAAGLPG